ncbi:MAG TPA: tetratricopeptide repeat protein [Desulfatiglandales bacterium]|nr:tetratricopeptide repeat protein [Desulfatiglandales bacterium]
MNVKHPLIPDKRIKPPGAGRNGLWILLILFIAVLIGVYLLWPYLNNSEPRLNYLKIVKDGESLNLLKGETIHFRPRNKIRILNVSTNIFFNRGVRLVTEGLDINSLLYDDMLLSDLINDKEIYGPYSFRVWVKRYNQDIGYVDIVIEPLAEDLLDKADRSIEIDRKIEVLKRALEIFPDERRIKERLAREYISAKKLDEAATMLEGMIKERPDKAILEIILDLYEKMSNKDGVISALKRLAELSPDDTALRLKLATALEDAGKSSDAIMEFERLLNRMSPQDLLPVYNSLGYLYAEAEKNEDAISFYLKALELNKDDTNIYYNLSLLYEKTGQKDKSNQYMAKVVELRPDSTDDNLRLARNLLEGGKLKEAEESLKEFLKDNPGSVDAWLLMTNIAEKNGDKAALKKAYEKILDINPQESNVIYNLGVMEYETGNADKALPYLERYVQSSPDDSDARSILFDIYKRQKKDDLAYKEASAIIRLKTNETDCYQYIFDYLNKKKRYSEIAGIMEAGVKANPKDVNVRKYLIISYLNTGKEDKALTQIKAVLDLTPDDTALLMQLAKLYEKRDRPDEALAAYRKVLDISPDNKEAEEAYLDLRLKTLPNE